MSETTRCSHGIPDDQPCFECEMTMLSSSTRAQVEALVAAVKAADHFFKTVMPNMNVKQSYLSAENIGDWNNAEIAIGVAMRQIKS